MKLSPFIFIGCFTLLAACNFSVGTNKDLSTGLSYTYHGFAVEKVLLAEADTIKSNNEVAMETKVAIAVEGLTNYTLKDEKAFPGLMLLVTDKEGNTVINEPDLFSGGNGYPPQDAAYLQGSVTVGNPMKPEETYHVKMRVWDKNNPESELIAEIDLVVK